MSLSSSVPDDFGASFGTEISNKHTLLTDIDRALGLQKSPDIEYLFVLPYMRWHLHWLTWVGFAGNYYGHAAVKYTHPYTGEQVVMNINGGSETPDMVNFLKAEDYFFGTDFEKGNTQGGIYNRNIVSVRVENVPREQILDMDYFYKKLKRNQREKVVKFSLLLGAIWNWIAGYLPVDVAERGNCAYWTSKGLVEAQLLRFPSIFPKRVLVNVFERCGQKDPSNVHIVSYRRVKHAKLTYGEPQDPWISGVVPLAPITNLLYLNLEKFAHVVVEVPPNSITAEIKVNPSPVGPSWFRYNWSTLSLAVITAGFVLRLFAIRLGFIRKKPPRNVHKKFKRKS